VASRARTADMLGIRCEAEDVAIRAEPAFRSMRMDAARRRFADLPRRAVTNALPECHVIEKWQTEQNPA